MLSKPILINNFSGGIADSPYRGIPGSYASMVGLDIHTDPGIAQLAQKMVKVSGSVVVDTPYWIVAYNSSKIFALGHSQKVYYSSNGGDTWTDITSGTQSAGFGQGAIIFNNYLIVVGTTRIDLYGPISGTPTWTINWKTVASDGNWHPMLIGKRDGYLYIGAANYIALLIEVAGQIFDPANAATYSWNDAALTISSDFKIKSLEEQGDCLAIGCWQGTNIGDFSTAITYFWNYVLQSQNPDSLIEVRECGINAQLSIGNILYIFAGIIGNFYYYNGVSLIKLRRVPFCTRLENWGYVNPGAVANFKGMPHFGMSEGAIGGSCLKAGIYNFGSFGKNYSSALNLEYPISAGATDVRIGSICPVGQSILLVGWNFGSTYGIDKLNNSERYEGGGYFETLLYRLGLSLNKQIIEGFEIILDHPLSTGQAITIKFRRDTSASWTTVKIGTKTKTFSYAQEGAQSSFYVPFQINNVVNMQFRVELGGATASIYTPRLKEIIIQ